MAHKRADHGLQTGPAGAVPRGGPANFIRIHTFFNAPDEEDMLNSTISSCSITTALSK